MYLSSSSSSSSSCIPRINIFIISISIIINTITTTMYLSSSHHHAFPESRFFSSASASLSTPSPPPCPCHVPVTLHLLHVLPSMFLLHGHCPLLAGSQTLDLLTVPVREHSQSTTIAIKHIQIISGQWSINVHVIHYHGKLEKLLPWHPRASDSVRFQNVGLQVSQALPITLGLQSHWPVVGWQRVLLAESFTPERLHAHAVDKDEWLLGCVGKIRHFQQNCIILSSG